MVVKKMDEKTKVIVYVSILLLSLGLIVHSFFSLDNFLLDAFYQEE